MCKLVEWSYTDPQAAKLAEQNGWVVPPEEVVERTLGRLSDVMCTDTETDPPTVISALSYIPPPYRSAPEKTDLTVTIVVSAAGLFVLLVIFLRVLEKRRQSGNHVWKVRSDEVIFGEPPQVIGQGSFGTVTLAEYRGTQVAVKRIFRSKTTRHNGSSRDTVGSGLSSGSGIKNSGNSGSVMLSSSTRSVNRNEFIEEMRVLSKLRHPCITTIMGAVLERGNEAMLLMEYMERGSLYDILHNQTTILEKDLLLPILQDIIQGMRFLHSSNPAVIHGDLKTRNILVDKNFRAKVCTPV